MKQSFEPERASGCGTVSSANPLEEYAGEAKIRMAAIAAFDGIIPLGPEFLGKCADAVKSLTTDKLEQNAAFHKNESETPQSEPRCS